MKPMIFFVCCFALTFAHAQTKELMKKELTSGSEKQWNLNRSESDSIKNGVTLMSFKFFMTGRKVEIHSCEGDSCTDESLKWQLDSLDGGFSISFARKLNVLMDNKTFEIQFVLKNGSEFLRLRKNGVTVEEPTLDFYFQ